MKRLNVGAGRDIRKGWINLDSHNKKGADVVHDLNNLPLPFKNNTFDYIYCGYVLEDFTNPIPLMEDLIRITKPGGRIEIQVGNETSCWDNLYHKRGYTINSLKNFAEREDYGVSRNVRVVESKFYYHKLDREVSFSRKIFVIYQRIMAFFCNLLPSSVIDYTFLKYLFAGVTIKIVYQKLK